MTELPNANWITDFQQNLITWYDDVFRDLPWRATSDPYKIWVSEIMLQQTQVAKVIPYYENFISQFDSIEELANADLAKVLKVWEGLGYYARARNLHKAAQVVTKEHNGKFPQNIKDIIALPGIGAYTAAAIASIAFNQQHAVVDGNVIRVLARLFKINENGKSNSGKKEFQNVAEKLLNPNRPGDHNQSLMELGATVCKPSSPNCGECSVRPFCAAFEENLQSEFPVKSPTKKRPHKIIAVGIVENGGKVLIARRPEDGMLGGLWEFPGGKVEEGESLEDCVVRELKEELDISVNVDSFFMHVDHQYTHFTITLHAFFCRLISGEPKAIGCTDWKWEERQNLQIYAFPKANKTILEALLEQELKKS